MVRAPPDHDRLPERVARHGRLDLVEGDRERAALLRLQRQDDGPRRHDLLQPAARNVLRRKRGQVPELEVASTGSR